MLSGFTKLSKLWVVSILLSMSGFLCSCNGGGTSVSANNLDAKTIVSYSLNGIPGAITGQNITVVMSRGTEVESLVATFVTTGVSVTVNGVPQISGSTANDFTNPVTYIVTAADGSTASYVVNVTVSDLYVFNMEVNHVEGVNTRCSQELFDELTHSLAVDPQIITLSGYYDIEQAFGAYSVVNYQDLGIFMLSALGIKGVYDFGSWLGDEGNPIVIGGHTYSLYGIVFNVPGECTDQSNWGTCGVLKMFIFDPSIVNGICALSS